MALLDDLTLGIVLKAFAYKADDCDSLRGRMLLAVWALNRCIATSVASEFWLNAEIYPAQRNHLLTLSDERRQQLARFR
ncbi:MAG TPA: hypothetical protein VFN35_26180 [Ktedonobacteraceae bacterium]|nr:hypothetical protein [Ktedonobacteraceae bacterium]